MRTMCYVDGFNLYHSISELRRPALKWLDLRTLAHSFLTADDELAGVVYFTAIADWNPDKARRHRTYIAALRERGVEVIISRFQQASRQCKTWQRSCPFQEEKETDVAFASRVLLDALTGAAHKQVIVTADTDQVPMLKHVRERCPDVHVLLAAPPGRLIRARALQAVVTRYTEIGAERLGGSLLPRYVLNAAGKAIATCPAAYFPEGVAPLC